MTLVHWPSLDEIDRMRWEIEQILEEPPLLRWPGSWDGLSHVAALDLYETAEQVVIQAALPGVRPEDIRVAVESHTVIIEGETQRSGHVSQEHDHRRERRLGKFVRSVTVPDYADMDHAGARFEDGVLTITLPKLPHARPRTIPVRVESPS